MLTKVINKIKSLLSSNAGTGRVYPFTYFQPEYQLNFQINNPIEEFRLKEWGGEKEFVIEMMNELKAGDVFYDVGSSVGLVSVIAGKIVGNGKVVSFEPDPENIRRLKENYRVNGITNCIVQELAVGTEKSTMQLYTAGSNNFSPSLQKVNGIERSIEVEVNSIDNLLANGSIPYPNIVKIDIEGAEMMALQGMKNLLKSSRRPRIIFMEIHPDFLPSFSTTTEEIMQYLAQFEYSVIQENSRNRQFLVKLVSKA
jgi:FkbM family methyltransferase